MSENPLLLDQSWTFINAAEYPLSVFLFYRREDEERYNVQPWAVHVRIQCRQLPVGRRGEQWGVQSVSVIFAPRLIVFNTSPAFLTRVPIAVFGSSRKHCETQSSVCFHVPCTVFPHRFTFIKNIPNQSQQPRAVSALRDMPPKTRSTPAATMVLDLVSFSNMKCLHRHLFCVCVKSLVWKVLIV